MEKIGLARRKGGGGKLWGEKIFAFAPNLKDAKGIQKKRGG